MTEEEKKENAKMVLKKYDKKIKKLIDEYGDKGLDRELLEGVLWYETDEKSIEHNETMLKSIKNIFKDYWSTKSFNEGTREEMTINRKYFAYCEPICSLSIGYNNCFFSFNADLFDYEIKQSFNEIDFKDKLGNCSMHLEFVKYENCFIHEHFYGLFMRRDEVPIGYELEELYFCDESEPNGYKEDTDRIFVKRYTNGEMTTIEAHMYNISNEMLYIFTQTSNVEINTDYFFEKMSIG